MERYKFKTYFKFLCIFSFRDYITKLKFFNSLALKQLILKLVLVFKNNAHK